MGADQIKGNADTADLRRFTLIEPNKKDLRKSAKSAPHLPPRSATLRGAMVAGGARVCVLFHPLSSRGPQAQRPHPGDHRRLLPGLQHPRLGLPFDKLRAGLEKVYENALAHELGKRGFTVATQAPVRVHYDGVVVGEYFADLLVDEKVIVELKSAAAIAPQHEAQLINYLKATDIDVGLVLNPSSFDFSSFRSGALRACFGPKPEVKRKVYETARRGG